MEVTCAIPKNFNLMAALDDYVDGFRIQVLMDMNKKAWFMAEHVKCFMRENIESTKWYGPDTIYAGDSVIVSMETVKNLRDKFLRPYILTEIENLVKRLEDTVTDKSVITLPEHKETLSFKQVPFEYDFNVGARVRIFNPGNYTVNFIDMNTGYVFGNNVSKKPEDNEPMEISSPIKYFVPWRIEIRDAKGNILLEHEYNPVNKTIAVSLVSEAIGDTLSWVNGAVNFLAQLNCGKKYLVSQCKGLNDMIRKNIPKDIIVVDSIKDLPDDIYATYYVGAFLTQHERARLLSINPRQVGLLNIPSFVFRPFPIASDNFRIRVNCERKTKEPYVCISTHGSSLGKNWNYPGGWHYLVKWLKDQGYRVLHIDLESVVAQDEYVLTQPNGVEDCTGSFSLETRAEQLKYADFFIGVSSGLSWLADSVGTPVVLVSGLTQPFNEFYTPYRVINTCVCHGCYNDCSIEYNKFRFDWCPKHQYDSKKFECTKAIQPAQVINACAKLMDDYGLDPKNGVSRDIV